MDLRKGDLQIINNFTIYIPERILMRPTGSGTCGYGSTIPRLAGTDTTVKLSRLKVVVHGGRVIRNRISCNSA